MERLSLLVAETESAGEHGAWWAPIVFSVLICLFIVITGRIAILGLKAKVPRSIFSRLYEHLFLFIENMCIGVIGPHGRKYIPLVFTVYLFVLCSNLLGLTGLMAPTSQLGVTFGMAVIVVMYVQGQGIKTHGLGGYVKHFFGPPLGSIWLVPISFLLFFIELISEAAKMLSLSLRLQGNMSGEHRVGEVIGGLVKIGNFSVPLHGFLFPLSVFVCIVQALVFTMLTCVYISLFTSHDHEEQGSHTAAHAH